MGSDAVAMWIKNANSLVDKVLDQMLCPYGLSSAEFRLLKYLYINSCKLIRQMDVEVDCVMTPRVASLTIKSLEEKRYVTRITDPGDKRSKLIVLTDYAWKVKRDILAISDSVEDQITRGLTDSESEQLVLLLKKCINA